MRNKVPSGYVKCEKRNGALLLTIMRGVPGGHVLAAQGECAEGDTEGLRAEVIRMIDKARFEAPRQEKQADGNS